MNFSSKILIQNQLFLLLVIAFILTNFLIVFNIHIFRQISSFLFFSIIPGLLIIDTIIKTKNVCRVERFLLSVGLSISLLILTGLLLNYLHPYLLKPLSLPPMLIALDIEFIALLIFHLKNSKKFSKLFIPNINLNKSKNRNLFLIPLLFPIISIIGTNIMNVHGNNLLIFLLVFIIILYLFLISFFLKTYNFTYPIAVYAISLSLLLMHSLTSNHIMGRDIHTEYFLFSLTAEDFYWNIYKHIHPYNSCLSITILPTIYWQLVNINPEYIFKLIFPFIGALSPICVYYITLNYFGKVYSFFSALLFTFQTGFLYQFQSATRQELAIFFFALSVMVYFNKEIENSIQRALIMLFSIIIIFCHYTTAYLYIFILIIISIFNFYGNLKKSRSILTFYGYSSIVTPVFGIFLLCFSFLWFSQITEVPFNNLNTYMFKTFTNLNYIFIDETRDITVMKMVGAGVSSIPNYISLSIYYTLILIISIGLVMITLNFILKHGNFEKDFVISGWACFFVLLSLFLPYASTGYGAPRVFAQYLILLAPLFIVGVNSIFRTSKPNKKVLMIIAGLLALQLLSVTSLTYHFYGIAKSPDYELEGEARDEYYIFDKELASTNWLNKFRIDNLTIHSDRNGYSRIMLGFDEMPSMNLRFFKNNRSVNEGYIYLGSANIIKKTVRIEYFRLARSNESIDFEETKNIESYSNLFAFKNLIYQNNGSEVYL